MDIHTVFDLIAGAIVGAERYKLVRGIKSSTGVIFVAPLAAGIARKPPAPQPDIFT
jgi:hypothetical protein